MDVGTVLLASAILFLLSDVTTLALTARNIRFGRWNLVFLAGGSILSIISYGLFITNLFTHNFAYDYVYRHLSANADVLLSIAASWSGQSGSYYLWTMFSLVIYLGVRVMHLRFGNNRTRTAAVVLGTNMAFLALLTLIKDPFKASPPETQAGIGLNPVLSNFWNLVHPPVIFFAYALFLVPFAFAVAQWYHGRETSENDSLDHLGRVGMALGWLVLSVGIAMGGYWAYITLGWGGFWAWDPVETASLIPWLFATLFFHGSPSLSQKKVNYARDFLAVMPYITVVFASVITRSGLLFSVHSFGTSPSNIFLFSYLVALLALVGGLFWRRSNIQLFVPTKKLLELIQSNNIPQISLYLSFLAIFVGTGALLLGLIIPLIFALLPEPFTLKLVVDQNYFNLIIGVFGLICLGASFFTDLVYLGSLYRRTMLLFGTLALSIMNALLGLPSVAYAARNSMLSEFYQIVTPLTTRSLLANIIIPIVGVLVLVVIYSLYRMGSESDLKPPALGRNIGRALLHIGIIIALFGALFSTNLDQAYSATLVEDSIAPLNKSLSIKLSSVEYQKNVGEYRQSLTTLITLTNEGGTLGTGEVQFLNHRAYGSYADVLIVSDYFTDYYITILTINFNETDGTLMSVRFQVRTIPMINLLWAGCVVIFVSMAFLTATSVNALAKQFSKEIHNEESSNDQKINLELM